MFIGYPRSGHSLIGSLLDAHPDAVIAHELDALAYVRQGMSKKQLYELLLERSQGFTEAGREWNGYAYRIPNQWQGRFRKLRVIGDKKGGKSTRTLASDFDLLHRLQRTVATDVRFIHVIRNPYDNIATMFKQSCRNRSLSDTVRWYLALCESNAYIKSQAGSEAVFDLRHEDFVREPERILADLCEFLELEHGEDYLADCASLVYESPHKSRYDTDWDAGSLALVRDGIDSYGFLRGYSYEDLG